MTKSKMYTFTICPYCTKAKNLLNRKNIQFDEINISGDDTKLSELQAETGMATVPQIWVGSTFIGGCDDLYALDASGELDQIIAKES